MTEDHTRTAVPADTPIDLTGLGQRLRSVRTRLGWTRADVARRSGGRWTATALGTYERGERVISAAGLLALAAFYQVPVAHLLDGEAFGAANLREWEHQLRDVARGCGPLAAPAGRGTVRSLVPSVVIDTERLALSGRWPGMQRFVDGIRQVRLAPTQRLVPLRQRDLPYIAAVHNASRERFLGQLAAQGVLAVSDRRPQGGP